MSLCPSCEVVNVHNLLRELDDLPPWWEQVSSKSQPRGMVHLEDATKLPASALAGCPLCGLILDAVLQNIDRPSPFSTSIQMSQGNSKQTLSELKDELAAQPIYLRPNYDPLKPSFPEDSAKGAWHVRGLRAFVPVHQGRVLTGWIRLFADQDSSAGRSGDVIGRPSLSSSDSPAAFDLIQQWMDACLARHDICRETLSGTIIDESAAPNLPTRVVRVGSPGEGVCPQLFETQGERGQYIAFSHCWGSPAHRPLMTTRANLVKHLASIPWNDLPRTYQDAISATHRLGFEYIWIDSLCIIQDSNADWLSESQRMGDVYQHARLTIAASHASDSSEPCFFTRPPPLPAVELSHISSNGRTDGTICASLLPSDYAAISPEFGPLAYRAWASQEWLLSRRMVFYTAGSLVWSCKAISQRETGASFHSTARNPRWKNIVEKYSARLLTKQTDRLVALQGVVTALATKRQDDTYCLGLWKNSMPDQLLWYCLQPATRSEAELRLPTWTWASSLHGVRFLDIKGAKNVCGGFRFDATTQTLTIRGVLRRIAHFSRFAESKAAMDSPIKDVAWDVVDAELLFAFRDAGERFLGWCILDEDKPLTSDVFCLRLMSNKRDTSSQGAGDSLCKDWVLVLQHTNALDEYKRVGIGRLSTSQLSNQDLRAVDVHIA